MMIDIDEQQQTSPAESDTELSQEDEQSNANGTDYDQLYVPELEEEESDDEDGDKCISIYDDESEIEYIFDMSIIKYYFTDLKLKASKIKIELIELSDVDYPLLETKLQNMTEAVNEHIEMIGKYKRQLVSRMERALQWLNEIQSSLDLPEIADAKFDLDLDSYDICAIANQMDAHIQALDENDQKLEKLFTLLATCECCELEKEVNELYSMLAEADSDWEEIDDQLQSKEEEEQIENNEKHSDVPMKEENRFDVVRYLLGFEDDSSDSDFDTEEIQSWINLPDDISDENDDDNLSDIIDENEDGVETETQENMNMECTSSEDEIVDLMSDLMKEGSKRSGSLLGISGDNPNDLIDASR